MSSRNKQKAKTPPPKKKAVAKKKTKGKVRRVHRPSSVASNMDVPVGERAGRLQTLGQQLANIDAATTAFKKSHRISVPTSNGAVSLLVSMDITTKEARKQVLEMMDECRQQVEDKMAALLKKNAA